MSDDTPGRQYWPTDHDLARQKRMREDRGHFTNCRHYKKTGDRLFHCTKTSATKKTCDGCMVCPNCGGPQHTHSLGKSHHRDQVYIFHSKTCVLCGAYVEQHYVIQQPKHQEKTKADRCTVQGCKHTAFEGLTHQEGDRVFLICLTHKRRIKTWRLHPDKGEAQRPLLLVLGKLIDNPQYELKQGKRKP